MTRRLALAGVAALGAGLALPTAGLAAPSPKATAFRALTGSCGKAVVDPKKERPTFVLQNDIGPCKSDGLIFEASNVTLDLNGHEIKGTPLVGTPTNATGGFGEGVGIRLVGNSQVTITNSKAATNPSVISDFDVGILIQGSQQKPARYNTVKNIELVNNVGKQDFGGGGSCNDAETPCEVSDFNDGLALIGAESNTIGPSNRAAFNGSGGIRLDHAAVGNTIAGNTIEDNVGNGVRFMSQATGNVVTGNTIRRNATGVNFSFENPDNVVEDNVISANRAFGVGTGYHSERTVIRDNVISSNRSGGITLGSGENTVSGNVILDNGRGANGLGRGNGIFVGSGTDNFPRVGTVVSQNSVHGSGGNGIRIGCLLDQDPSNFAIYGCLVWDTRNQVSGNTVTGNGVNGPSGTKVVGGGQVTGVYDLLDSTNADPATVQSPFDPSGQPLTNCGTNTWSDNTFTTAFPACTTA